MKAVVLGVTGMLGHMVAQVLALSPDIDVIGTYRQARISDVGLPRHVRLVGLDAEEVDDQSLASLLEGSEWVVNAIGLIKPYIRDAVPDDVEQALRVNALFPHQVARAAEACGTRVLQIATDCVYSGATGGYTETSPHDAHDVYGKTKSLGEVRGAHVHHLRASVVGPERIRQVSLLEWFLGRPHGAKVSGFTTHRWNGVTTLQFARVCAAVILHGLDLPERHHLVPADTVSKHELLRQLGRAFGREDIVLKPTAVSPAIDRTLRTEDERLRDLLWRTAGYSCPPTIGEMVNELASVAHGGLEAA